MSLYIENTDQVIKQKRTIIVCSILRILYVYYSVLYIENTTVYVYYSVFYIENTNEKTRHSSRVSPWSKSDRQCSLGISGIPDTDSLESVKRSLGPTTLVIVSNSR